MQYCMVMHFVLYCILKGGVFMKSVYILMHQRKPNAAELVRHMAGAFANAGITAYAEPWLRELAREMKLACFHEGDPEQCEAIIALGGDGTLLRANALAITYDLPVLGVNIGRVGFLTEIELDQLAQTCQQLARDEYSIEKRMMLEACLDGNTQLALNDVVLSRGGYARLIGIDAWVGDERVGHFLADGLIISTATGSTGYSLSAGGPIICPELECMVLTPICAHSLQHRPVVTSAQQTVTVRLTDDVKAMVSIDGQEPVAFGAGQVLTVTRSARAARFIRVGSSGFFGKIRIKLSEWSC